MSPLPNPVPLRWRAGLTLPTVLVAVVVGGLYGATALYEANYIYHLLIALFAALLLYGLLRLPPDGDPFFCLFITGLATLIMLAVGWWVAIDFITDDFPEKTTWQAIQTRVAEGVIYQERFYGRSGMWVNRLRSGSWVYLAWLVQVLTLPVILFFGALSGGFRAHTKSTPAANYETALDIISERNAEAANPFNWQPLGNAIRGLHLGQLVRDLRYNYASFFWPVVILFGVVVLIPDGDAKPLIIFWASLFCLQAAAAVMTGTQNDMRLSLRAAFSQFFLFARLAALLILCFILGFLFSLAPIGFLVMAGIEWEDMFLHVYTALVGGAMGVIVVRLWPMMVMHSLFSDADVTANTGEGMGQRLLDNSFWHGAPGPSTAMAWQFTGSLEAFAKATLPALTLPVLIIALYSELYFLSPEPVRLAMDIVFYAIVVPYVYLIMIDRALALREWFFDDPDAPPPEITRTDAAHESAADAGRVDDAMQDFLDEVPRPLVEGGRSLALLGESYHEQKSLDEAGDDPDKLLAAAIRWDKMAWFEAALVNGADPSGGAEDGSAAHYRHLNRAVARGRIEMFDRLMAAGAEVHESLVHSAMSGADNMPMLEHVLDGGAEVNQRGSEGKTPLMIAADRGLTGMLRVLLARGANWRMTSDIGWSAIEWAIRGDRDDVLRVLVQEAQRHGNFETNDPDLGRSLRLKRKSLRVLLEAGMDCNLDLGDGRTLLHQAAAEADIEQIRTLLAFGANPHARDANGFTPANYAAQGQADDRMRGAYQACEEVLREGM